MVVGWTLNPGTIVLALTLQVPRYSKPMIMFGVRITTSWGDGPVASASEPAAGPASWATVHVTKHKATARIPAPARSRVGASIILRVFFCVARASFIFWKKVCDAVNQRERVFVAF